MPKAKLLAKILAIAAGFYHIIYIFYPVIPALLHRSLHLTVMLTLLIILKPAKRGATKDNLPIYDMLIIAVAWSSFAYMCINYETLYTRLTYVTPVTTIQFILGIAMVLIIFEGCRRTTGLILPTIASVFIIYAYVGSYLPVAIRHAGFSLATILDCVYLTTDGMFGDPINVSATYIALFIIFGSFLEKSGVGEAFIEFAKRSVGWARGGPAKVSVVSSALFGSVSGSAVGNVAVTGAFTIPLMKKSGFKSYYAAAVEAVASAGGQIMPPVMGAAAFIMSELIGMPYVQIIKHALIPAFLYFFGVFVMIDLRAAKEGLVGEEKFSGKGLLQFLAKQGYLFLPLIILIVFLVSGYTAIYAAMIALLACVLLSWVNPDNRMRVKEITEGLEDGIKQTSNISMTCACAGMVIGLISLTGIAVKFSMLIMSMSSQVLPVLFVVMLAGLFLGMGLPTTPAYIIQAGLITPSLVRLGLMPIQAHLFVLYFAVISVITPPVCLASYTAASIADAPLNKTGWTGLRLALAGFIVPFLFALNPSILMIGSWQQVGWSVFVTALGVYSLGVAVSGWLKISTHLIERLTFFVGALLMIAVGHTTDIIGISVFALALTLHLIRAKKQIKNEGVAVE